MNVLGVGVLFALVSVLIDQAAQGVFELDPEVLTDLPQQVDEFLIHFSSIGDAPMLDDTIRVLAQKGKKLHRSKCKRLTSGYIKATPEVWEWAVGKTLPQIRAEMARLKIASCHDCKPVDDMEEWYALGCPDPAPTTLFD